MIHGHTSDHEPYSESHCEDQGAGCRGNGDGVNEEDRHVHHLGGPCLYYNRGPFSLLITAKINRYLSECDGTCANPSRNPC